MKTIVLLSGGLDSTVVLAMQKVQCLALGFDYGQSHLIELDRAEKIAGYYRAPFERLQIPQMPKINDVVFAGRNLVLASLAIATAQARGFDQIAVGCNATDYERFPDCRPFFWGVMKQAAAVYGIGVETPLLQFTKRQIIEEARRLNVPIEMTWSCYSPINDTPCGECLACTTRKQAMQ